MVPGSYQGARIISQTCLTTEPSIPTEYHLELASQGMYLGKYSVIHSLAWHTQVILDNLAQSYTEFPFGTCQNPFSVSSTPLPWAAHQGFLYFYIAKHAETPPCLTNSILPGPAQCLSSLSHKVYPPGLCAQRISEIITQSSHTVWFILNLVLSNIILEEARLPVRIHDLGWLIWGQTLNPFLLVSQIWCNTFHLIRGYFSHNACIMKILNILPYLSLHPILFTGDSSDNIKGWLSGRIWGMFMGGHKRGKQGRKLS